MTVEIAICLAILAAAVILFAWDRIPADVVALGVLLAVIAAGLVDSEKAFAGFGSNTVLMILSLLIMAAGLSHTGIVDTAGRTILGYAGVNTAVLLPTIMIAVAVLSAFVSNTAATAFFIPIVLGVAGRTGTSPSRYLLPLAFASILTSSVTLISTSTNIIVSEIMVQYKQSEMGMFELAPVGIPIAVTGLIYIWLIGVRLMGHRDTRETAKGDVGERHYRAEVVVPVGSPLIGKTLAKSLIGENSGLTAVRILRGGAALGGKGDDVTLQSGDEIVIDGLRADILKLKYLKGIELKADVHLADPSVEAEKLVVVEGVLMPNSPLIGRTLSSAEFNDRYGLQVLGLNRAGLATFQKLSRIRMRLGDVLLLQGPAENVEALARGNLFNIFGGVDTGRLNTSYAVIAVAIFAASLLAATLQLVALPVAVLGGAFLMLLTGCISPEEAYRRVEWKVLILIGSLLSLGTAMEATGTGKFLATQVIALVGDESPLLLLGCFFILTVVLTQPMSNQAAAIIIVPIAIETALQLNLNPRTFAMMVAVAASCSYLTPLEPSSLMVYGPGKYRFADFFKVGLPLTFLIFVIALVLVPLVWPM